MEHVATIKAFERKAELGGGFRATFSPTQAGIGLGFSAEKSEVLARYEEAKYLAQKFAHDAMTSRGFPQYQRAYISRRFAGNNYEANIWI